MAPTGYDDKFSSEDESDSESLFDTTSDTEDEGNDEDEEILYEDEVRHPPEHYRVEAAKLDMQRLRQQRYSPLTRQQIDRVRTELMK